MKFQDSSFNGLVKSYRRYKKCDASAVEVQLL